MIEVEIKLPLRDRGMTEKGLLEQGFVAVKVLEETDTYFNGEGFEIRKADMALRVRCCENKENGEKETFFTYKGAKMDPVSMTRKELETEVGDGEVCREILRSIGFYEIGTVRKRRQCFQGNGINACMDQVEGLGDFLELESLVESEEEREAALDRLEEILQKLGYQMKDTVRRSYLSMLGV